MASTVATKRFDPSLVLGMVDAWVARLQFLSCCHTGSSEIARYTVRIVRALKKKNAPKKRENRTSPNDVLQRT